MKKAKLDILGLVSLYLESKQNAWEPTTMSSESTRLRVVAEYLDGNAARLWAYMDEAKLGRYTRLTTWVRVTAFYDWLKQRGIVHGENPYKVWRAENARLFKNSYVRRPATISFTEAVAKIKQIPDVKSRELATSLLSSGLRYNESGRIKDGLIRGKTGMREVYGISSATKYPLSYFTFRRHLADVGLKPHDLRKIFASRLVEKGFTEFDLLEVMGWASLETAKSYIGPRNKKKLHKAVKLATFAS